MIPEESGASAGESCRSRHRSSASAAPRSALPRLRTRLAGSATARRRAGARPPPLRLLPCAPLDVGREDRFPLGTRLREDRARVVSGGARAISVPGHAGRSGMGSQAQKRSTASCSSSCRRSAHRDNSVPPFSPPPPPPPRALPPSPPPSISQRRVPLMARAPRSLAPRRRPPSRRRSARGRPIPCQSRRLPCQSPAPPPPPPRAFSGPLSLNRRTAYKEKKRNVEGATLSTTKKARACCAGPASD